METVLIMEVSLIFLAAMVALFLPESYIRGCRKYSIAFDRLSRRRRLSILLVFWVAFGGSMAVSLLIRIPEPEIHDEFSYLLAADTYASGRITNTPHSLWPHFESIHIIQQPTYASKYPPAQGLILALGQVVGGHPVVGAWLGIALSCACICWMLYAWVPHRWALLGGLIAALNLGFFGYWSQNYWGGAMAAAAGALIFGALRHLLNQPTVGMSLTMGIGLIILANSRPLEGLISVLPVAAVLLISMFRLSSQSLLRLWFKKIVIPIALLVGLGAVGMCYYNYRVTGRFWQMPYQAYANNHPSTPIFLWSSKNWDRESQPTFYPGLLRYFEERQKTLLTVEGFVDYKLTELLVISIFFLHYMFLIPMIILPNIMGNRWNAFAVLTIALVFLVVFVQVQSYPRKAAPIAGLIIFVLIQCMRHLRIRRWRGKPTGRCFVEQLPVLLALSVLFSFHPLFQNSPLPCGQRRAALIRQLKKDPLPDLIIVRYGPNRYAHFEWVYNEADIDASDVVWARELGEERNQELIDYFKNRKIWLLKADGCSESETTLLPYSTSYGK